MHVCHALAAASRACTTQRHVASATELCTFPHAFITSVSRVWCDFGVPTQLHRARHWIPGDREPRTGKAPDGLSIRRPLHSGETVLSASIGMDWFLSEVFSFSAHCSLAAGVCRQSGSSAWSVRLWEEHMDGFAAMDMLRLNGSFSCVLSPDVVYSNVTDCVYLVTEWRRLVVV